MSSTRKQQRQLQQPTEAIGIPGRQSRARQDESLQQPSQQSILSICLNRQQDASQLLHQSSNNTPSSASASYRQHQQQQQNGFLPHHAGEQKPQQRPSKTTAATVIGKKTSSGLKSSYQKGMKQQALIQSIQNAGNPTAVVVASRVPTSHTPGSSGPAVSLTGSTNNGVGGATSGSANFSCLIQKQLTSLNYGEHPTGGRTHTTGGNNIANHNQGRHSNQSNRNSGGANLPHVTRSLEKLSTSNGTIGPTVTRNSGGNFALSQADLQHLQASRVTSSSQHNSVKAAAAQSNQYRGSQPQQKHKIKAAFKRIDAAEINSKAMMSQVSVSSAVSRNSGKRPSSNFVSLGGQSRTTNANVDSSSQGTQALKPPEPQKFKQGCSIPSSNPSLRNSLMSGVGGSMTGMPVANKPTKAVDDTATTQVYARSSSQQQQNTAAGVASKIGTRKAERIASSRGGKKPSMKVVRLTGSGQRAKDRLSSSSARSGGAQQKQQQSSNVDPTQQSHAPGMHSNRRRRTASSSQKKSSHAGRAADASSSPSAASNNAAGAEASYCPKQQLLNSSQEFVPRNNQLPSQVHKINSSNQACLLPGHFVQANGPSSMQASSRPIKPGGGNVANGFLPPQNILLSASFEKLNLLSSQQHNATTKSGAAMLEIRNQVFHQQQQKQHNHQNTSGTATSQSSISQNTTLRSHQQILRQNAAKMQNFINGQITTSPGPLQSTGKSLPYGNLKVKKQGIKTTTKHQHTPQRIKKVTKNNTEHQQQLPQQKNTSALDMTQKSVKQTNSKAQQYLRNSFMIKHHNNGSTKNINGNNGGTGSVSPRSNSGKHQTLMAVGISRNATHLNQAHTVNGFMPAAQSQSQSHQQSMLNTTNNSSNMPQPRLSPMSSSLQHQHQQQQNVSKFKVGGVPRNLNILTKGSGGMSKTFKQNQNNIEHSSTPIQQQQQLSQQQKAMIDKKTYEDLMNYLVKTECKRLKQDPTMPKAPGSLIVSTPNQSGTYKPIVPSSNSNINLISSAQQRRNTSGKKTKTALGQQPVSTSASHLTFQSQQPIRQNNVGGVIWQPQMTLNQTLSKQLDIDLPATDSAVIAGEAHSAETMKQPSTSNHKQQARLIPANISQVATVSTFMPATTTTSGKGIKMLKSTISQSQSRDASLTSQNTNENQGSRTSHAKYDHNAVILAAQRKQSGKQVLNSRNGMQKAPTHQLSLKGTKAGQSRNGGAALLSALSGIKTGTATNVNNTVFSVSIKPGGNSSNQTMIGGISQASPKHTFIIQPSKQQSRNGKKNALGTSGGTIPTKIIKARSLIRGAPGQAPLGGAKSVMNVLKRQGMTDSVVKGAGGLKSDSENHGGGHHQETLKNNFMQQQESADQTAQASLTASVDAGCPPKLPTGRSGNNTGISGSVPQQAKTPGLRELQFKALNLPMRERVQSAKSSSTNQQNLSSSQSNQKASLLGGRGGTTPTASNQMSNGGALSHRESQRYFSRPTDDQGQPQPQSSTQARKMVIKQPIERPRSRSKLSAAAQQQSHINNSKERKQSQKHLGDSYSKDQSSRKNNKRHSNSSARPAKVRSRQRSSTVDRGSSLKKGTGSKKGGNSLVGMLPLDMMVGQAETDEIDGSLVMGNSTILSKENLIDTIILNSSDIIGNEKVTVIPKHPVGKNLDDALACMTGGNFNTFGEHENGKQSLADLKQGETYSGPANIVASSTKLIEQIEHQIEQELREGKDSEVLRDPKFELMLLHDQQSNESGENTLDEQQQQQTKPPQNSMVVDQTLVNSSGEVLLQTLKSREQSSPNTNPAKSSKASIKDFHYSGSFGIPNSSSQGGGNLTLQMERELIEIGPALLYEESDDMPKEEEKKKQVRQKPPKLSQQQEQKQKQSQQHKSQFQLINMSFSQEAALLAAQKNPHNTLIVDESSAQESSAEKQVSDKLYSDPDYRKQLLLRVLPDFKKLNQFDQLHLDIVGSKDQHESPPQQDQVNEEKNENERLQMAVSRGAAQLLRQINLSLGRDNAADEQKQQYVNLVGAEDAIDDDDEDAGMLLETNTVVENECDSEQQYLYHAASSGTNAVNRDFSSPSVTSDRQGLIKSFDTTSIHSPQNQTCIELQTPSNLTSVMQSHQASQNTTNLYQLSCEEETRLTLLQSSEPESNRKQGGAFPVFSPRTAAIYEDGANGGKQAIQNQQIPAPNSVRHSNQLDEESTSKQLFLPRFGLGEDSKHEEEAEEEEENQSFQTMLVEGEAAESLGGDETPDPQVTSFYGPDQPQYEEIVSIMQTDAYAGDLIDEQTLNQYVNRGNGGTSPQIIAASQLGMSQDDEDDTGGGSVAASHSPHSIRKDDSALGRYQHAMMGDSDLKDASAVGEDGIHSQRQDEDGEDEYDDQFQFVENLNKQYADAMKQRKIMKMMNKPRQNSC